MEAIFSVEIVIEEIYCTNQVFIFVNLLFADSVNAKIAKLYS